MKPRASGFSGRLAGLCLLLSALGGLAQGKPDQQASPPLPPEEGRALARELIGNLLKLKPETSATQSLLVKIRDDQDNRKEIPVRFEVVSSPTNFVNIYQVLGKPGAGAKLTIVHAESEPNQYWLSEPADATARRLAPGELMTPLAGSDFWVADLGLEFLHWPAQRVVKKQMRKNLFCHVLESIDPRPAAGGYSKVVSWIAANRPDDIVIVHADAYDAQGKLLKQFDPRKIQKVDGAWELAEMEIRNRQTHSNTRIEFNPDSPP